MISWEYTGIIVLPRKNKYELEIVRPDKEKRLILLTVSPFYDDQKIFKGSLATFRDITERKRSEEEVKEQKEILKVVIESSMDGILVVDERGRVTHTNERFAEMWRIPKKLIETRDDNKLLDYVSDQLQDPQAFLSRVQRLYNSAEMDFDTLLFKDSREVGGRQRHGAGRGLWHRQKPRGRYHCPLRTGKRNHFLCLS
ncbi:MAG: PAS domain S-box protein [Candidatus Aminicenantes bacterium]|jgi:PAS domain-containing protein